MKKDFLLNLAGLIFITFGILGIIISIKIKDYDKIFWFCYIGLILIGIGAIRKNSSLIISQLNILSVPTIIWVVDFFGILIFRKSLFKISEYFFIPEFGLLSKFISLQHLITIPLAFFCIYLIGQTRKDNWKISIFEIIIVYLISRFFTNPIYNMNCVYKSCIPLNLPGYYFIWWFIYGFLIIFLTNFFINYIFYKKR